MTTGARQSGALLAHLRTVTRPAHDMLEGALGLLDERLDRETYKLVLERFHGFWCGWEPQVAALLHDGPFLHPRRRLHLLKADLAVLGSSAGAVAALPACPLPMLQDAVEALGSVYVMEGSTLGGRVIQRNVKRRLGFDGGSGCAYFAGYGANTGMMWRLFLARLEEAAATDAERIATGATATFECLARWLPRNVDIDAQSTTLSGALVHVDEAAPERCLARKCPAPRLRRPRARLPYAALQGGGGN